MNFDEILEGVKAKAANADPLGATVKFQLGEQCIYIDGTGDSNTVSADDKEADCLMIAEPDDFEKMMAGELNSMMAVMSGKLKIKGDMGVAMKLQSIVG